MDMDSWQSQGQQPQSQVNYQQQDSQIRVSAVTKDDVIEWQTSIGNTINITNELRDDDDKGEHLTVRDGNESRERIPSISFLNKYEQGVDSRAVTVDDGGGVQSIVRDVAKETDTCKRQTFTGKSNDISGKACEGRRACSIIENQAIRDSDEYHEQIPGDVVVEDDDMLTVTLSSSEDQYKICHGHKQNSDKYNNMIDERLVVKNGSSKMQAFSVDASTPKPILAPIGERNDKLMKIVEAETTSKTDRSKCRSKETIPLVSEKIEGIKGDTNIVLEIKNTSRRQNNSNGLSDCNLNFLQLHEKARKECNQHLKTPPTEIPMDTCRQVELLRDFYYSEHSTSNVTTKGPARSIKGIFTTIKGGFMKRKKNGEEIIIRDDNQTNEDDPYILTTKIINGNDSEAIEKDYDPHLNPHVGGEHHVLSESLNVSEGKHNIAAHLKDSKPIPPPSQNMTATSSSKTMQNSSSESLREPIEKNDYPHLNLRMKVKNMLNVSRHKLDASCHKSEGKQSVSKLLKEFPPLPPEESSSKIRRKQPRRRRFEFGKVKSLLSSVRTVTSKDSIITTLSSTAKDSDQGSNNMRQTSVSSKTSLVQRFNMRSMGIRSNSQISKLQEERFKQEDLVRDALHRHRALTGDESEIKFAGTNKVDSEKRYQYQSRITGSDMLNRDLEFDSLSLSDHEDIVSVETTVSDVTLESGKQSVHAVEFKRRIVIPDVICLQKPRRGFFRKKKLWTKVNLR